MTGNDSMTVMVRALIALLCTAALLAIVVIASGSELDETNAQLVGTAVALAFFSLTGVAGSNLARRRPEIALFGYFTALVSIVAFILVTAAIWEWHEADWEPAGIAIVLAIAGGHASLLFASARSDDQDAVRLTRNGVLLAIAILALIATVEISADGEEISPQAFGIVAVLYILGTLLLPLVRRVSTDRRQPDAAGQVGRPQVVGLDEVAIAVNDGARTDSFFREVLGAERIAGPNGASAYRVGNQQLKVHTSGDSRVRLVWSGPIETAVEHLQRHGIDSVEGPVGCVGTQGPGRSVLFRDPDGGLVELISYR